MTTQHITKPQAAKDLDLLSRQEAAKYIGMGEDKFKTVSGQIPGIRLGAIKYYRREELRAFLQSKLKNTQN